MKKAEIIELLKDKDVRDAIKNILLDDEDWPQYAYVPLADSKCVESVTP